MSDTLYNLNIERAVLSAVMFDHDTLYALTARVDATLFYLPFHHAVFNAMVQLDREEKPIDEEFVASALKQVNMWDEVAMLDMLSANPISNIDPYVNELIEFKKKRDLATTATHIKKLVMEDAKPSVDVISTVDKKLTELLNYGDAASVKSTSHFIDEMEEDMRSAQEAGGVVGYRSGITTLDAKIGAFQPGDLVVIAARPSMGKTSLMTTIADYALKCGHGVLMDSLEMNGKKIMQRLISTHSGEPLSNIKRGLVSNLDSFRSSTNFYRNTTLLHIHDESYITINEIKARAIATLRKHPEVKYWFIDHVRYIKKPGVNIANEISEITKELKRIAKEYGIVVFLLSQLNRANEQRTNKRPMLSDLRESGAVEEDADIIIFPHRESYYQRNVNAVEPKVSEAELIIGKNRDGEAGICKCYFKGETTSFDNYGGVEIEYEEGGARGLDDRVEMPVM